jgi:PelA/Pel-15E family pectate lyase
MVKLYDGATKYKDCHLNKLMNKDLTVSFMIKISAKLHCKFILMCKHKMAELRIGLKKDGTINFYYGNGKKYDNQLASAGLTCNKWVHILFIRNMTTNKNILYIDGIVQKITIQPYTCIPCTNTDLVINKCYPNQYELKNVKVWNNTFGMKEPVMTWLSDTKSVSDILEYMYNISTECLTFINDGYTYIFNDYFFVYFKENASFIYETYIKFNAEKNDRKLLPTDGHCQLMELDELGKKMNTFDAVRNLISWQFGTFQAEHSKDISNGVNFWSLNEVSIFKPYTGKGLYSVTSTGTINDLRGTLQNGMVVSFVKLLVDYYVKNTDTTVLLSINNLVTWLLSAKYANDTIPYYTPQATLINAWEDQIAISNGTFLNWLKVGDVILNNTEIASAITSRAALATAHAAVLAKLLTLQVTVSSTLTIWAKYYDKTTLVPVAGANYEPAALCSLESAQILLYLMHIETPTTAMINAIKAAGDWFIAHKVTGYVQVNEPGYDLSPQDLDEQILLKTYTHSFPSTSYLHARYYDLTTQLPTFKDASGSTLYTLTTFNDMTKAHRNTHTMLGTWGQYVIGKYTEWKLIYT